MSIQAVAWALEQDIPARPKLVLVSLANHADHTNGYCWLKAETIGAEAACSPRAVFNFIGDLIRNGYVRKSLRKGTDGKQRANDFWLLFDRDPLTAWSSDRIVAHEAELDDGAPADENSDTQGVASTPHAPDACGETAVPTADQKPELPAGASGPHASTCIPTIDEPSKIKPKESSYVAAAPRGYRPPPPEPQGALHPDATKPVFVFEGTRAWEAWCRYKKATTGRAWTLTTHITVDGKRRSGWTFPSLFPPGTTGPSAESADDGIDELAMHH